MEKKIVSRAFYFLGSFSLLLLFPMMISGGSGPDDKGLVLLNQAGLGVGFLFCGFVLSKDKNEWRWMALIINSFMLIKLGLYIAENSLGPNGGEWLERNNILPALMLFLIYSDIYFLRIISMKSK